MSMSTHVIGFKPPDDKWKEMKAVYDACVKASVPIPLKVTEFFEYNQPDDEGVLIGEADLKSMGVLKEFSADMKDGFEVDITKLPKDIKIIRFYNSY